MTASENSQEQKLPEKEEFFDAVRRHICQALGFDFVFVDVVREPEIVNLISFSAEDEDKEAREFVGTLSDQNQQPLTVANTHVAQDVKKSGRPWIGKVFMAGGKAAEIDADLDDDDDELADGISADKEGYPYSIVPILQTPLGNAGTVRGLIRVLSFDPTREITQQDLATLKLMGEHLSTKMSQFAPTGDALPAQPNQISFDTEYVLICHSNRLVRRRYSRILGEKFQILEADSSDKALEALQNNRVDLIVLDSGVKGKSGYAFCRVLKESTEYKHVPVILVTSDTDPTARVDGLNVGADDCLSESCFDSELLARVKSSMRHRKTERELAIQLQLLEDYAQRLEQATEHLSQDKQLQLKRNRELELLRWESDILRSQDSQLHRISNTIRQSFNITENLHSMLDDFSNWHNFDCCFVVLPSEDEPEDSIRSEYYSSEEYQLMRQDVDLRTLEVFKQHFQGEQLLMANDAAHDRRLEPFRKGALPNYHFFSLFLVPITYEQKLLGLFGGYKCESQANWNRDNEAFLKSVADQIATGVTNARLYARVQRQATTDGLTSLYNHRTGQEKLAEQLRLAERYQRNLAVVMIDVDHFKSINDNYGHPAGDSVLKAVAKLVKSDCRDVDLPVRYGGEEFLLVLPEVNQEGAAVVAERIRKSLSQEIIRHEDIQISVTASFGIAAFPEDAHNQQQLLDLADKALYLSKRLGRNQVHTAGDLMFEEISPTKLPEAPRAEARNEEDDLDDIDDAADKLPEQKGNQAPAVVPSAAQQFTLPVNTYADFVPTAVSAAAEQKEELVPEVVEMVKALATALYSKSDYNKQHHLETARLSELLAKVMGLSQQQVEQIRVAGLLHDVGTLSIPSDLLNKPGKYNADEREIINQHAVLGAQLLRPIRALRDICEILENHHERWDGTGYPRGLKGEAIPLPARIVAIVDSYHAMISDRPYRDAMTREQAIQTLKDGAGVQWDPFLVDIFVAVLASLNDPRSAPLAAPTPVTPRLEAMKSAPATPAAPAAQAAPTAPATPDASSTIEPPVMNARQRLMQHSQQHQVLPHQTPTTAPTPTSPPTLTSVPTATQGSAANGANNDEFDDEDEFDKDLDTEAEDLAYPNAISERSDLITATAQTSATPAGPTSAPSMQIAQAPSEAAPTAPFSQTPAPTPASASAPTPAAPSSVAAVPTALEQLRRVPPEQQAAIFQQAAQRNSELPAHAQQGLAPQRAPIATPPETPAPVASEQAPQPTPLSVVQQASAQFIRPQPAPQLPTQPIAQPMPQQAPPQHISQPLPQQAPPQHISQSLPQQGPQAPQHISQPLPQQAPPQQHISQPLPQQAPPQHISQPLPQQAQQAPQQSLSQPLPQQQHPTAQQIAQQAYLQHDARLQQAQQAPQQPQPNQQPQQSPQYQTPQQIPVQPAPQVVPQQAPAPQNLFPHLQQLQEPIPRSTQPQLPNQAVPQQQYAPQNPQFTNAAQSLTPTNPLAPQERPAPTPAPQEHEQPRPAANTDQFFEEP